MKGRVQLLVMLSVLATSCSSGHPKAKAPPFATVAAATAATAASTISSTTSSTTSSTVPAACPSVVPTTIGTVQGGLNELSGLVASPSGAPILWGHNDSGDSARLFAISTADGTNIGEVKLTGANNDDWEDISSYRTNDGRNRLVIADTGDNDAKRNEVYLWVLDEPSANAKSAVADRVTIRFAEGPHDVETLFVDQAAGEVVLIGKRFGSSHAVPVHAFALADLQAGGVVTPAVIGPWTVPAGEPLGPTGGDVSADGQLLALRLPFRMFIWKREPGVAFSRTLVAGNEALCRMVLGSGQLESAAFLPDRRLVTGSEGDGTPLVASAPL